MIALGVSIPVDPALPESLDKPFPWAGHQRRKKNCGGSSTIWQNLKHLNVG